MKTLSTFILATTSLWSLTIEDAIERALKHSPLIHKAQSQVRYANTQKLEAEAAFHPRLDAGFYWQDTDKTTAFSFTPTHHYNLSVSYNIFNGFADKENLDATALKYRSEALLLTASRSDLKLEVVSAYIDYLKADKSVQTQEETLKSLQRSYSDTKIRYEQGMIAKNELLLIDVQRLRAEQSVMSAKSERIRSHEKIWRLLGGSVEKTEIIEDVDTEVANIQDFDSLLQRTYEQRSELHSLYLLRDALHHGYNALTGSYYPKVDLGADYIINDRSRYSGTTLVQVKDQWISSVNVSWNLYNGRANEAQRSGVMEQIRAIESDISAMKYDLHTQLNNAVESYHVAKSLKDVAQRAQESAEENFRITNDRYEYGEVDTLHLLSAQSDLTAARNAYNNAYYDLYLAYTTIERVSKE